MCVLVAQSCLTDCSPVYCSPPGSSVRGILQAGVLEWVPVSRESSRPRDGTLVSCIAGRLSPTLQADSLLHCRQTLSYIAGGHFTIRATKEALCV